MTDPVAQDGARHWTGNAQDLVNVISNFTKAMQEPSSSFFFFLKGGAKPYIV